MEAELKVVINIKGTRALVGVQGSDTDPVLEPHPSNPHRPPFYLDKTP